ncbi:MAG: YihY/virulence factor BrkB family protein [Sporichthyaceae bacterium]
MNVAEAKKRLDEAQRERRWLGVAVATGKKYGEDSSPALAAAMAFWAFFSLFPLLMAGMTVLGYALPDEDRARVLEEVAGYLPLLDTESVQSLQGNWLALTVGLGAALWSGMAVVRITQQAFNAVWEVPVFARPKTVEQVKRSLLTLGSVGLGLLVSIVLIGFLAGSDLGIVGRTLGIAAAIAADVGLFLLAFRILTDRKVGFREVMPGALLAGVAFWLLQTLSSVIITQHLSSAQSTYGTFATVITILWWFYLQAQITLLGMQLNVVLARDYHPRSLVPNSPTTADRRILQAYADSRRLEEDQRVRTAVPIS